MSDCIVIGAGISGLAVAAELFQREKEIVVLEAAARPGGTIDSLAEEGYLADFGPNSILHTTAHLDPLIRFAGLEGEVCPADKSSATRFVVKGGRLVPLPLSAPAFAASPLFSWGAKLGLLREPFVGRGKGEESIGAFTRRRLGQEFLDYAVGPFVSGVYAGDPFKLSARWGFPKVHALEERYGSLILGAIGGARERRRREKAGETGKQKAGLINFKKGMAAFPRAVAERLGGRVQLNRPVTALRKKGEGWEVEYPGGREGAKAVVLAVPAHAVAAIVEPLDAPFAAVALRVEYAAVAQVFLGFRRDQVVHPLDGFGALVPQKEGRQILGVLMNSSLFPGRAPEGHVALTCFLGGASRPDLAEKGEGELLEITLRELGLLLGVKGQPVIHRVRRWTRAIPQYNLGYGEIVDAVGQFEKRHPGIFVCANYRGGVAVGDCVREAAEGAEKINRYLEGRP